MAGAMTGASPLTQEQRASLHAVGLTDHDIGVLKIRPEEVEKIVRELTKEAPKNSNGGGGPLEPNREEATMTNYFAIANEIFGPQCVEKSQPPDDVRFGERGLISVDVTTGYWKEDSKYGYSSVLEELCEIHNEIKAKGNGADYRAVLTEWNRRSVDPSVSAQEADAEEEEWIESESANDRFKPAARFAFLDANRGFLGAGIPDPPAPSGGVRLTAQELLNTNGIYLKSYAPGQRSTTCPKCSATRSKTHQKTPCLSVKIDADGACWHCNHCGQSGPEKGQRSRADTSASNTQKKERTNGSTSNAEKSSTKSDGHGGGFVATYDYPGFQKVKYPNGHEPRFRIRHRVGNGWKWGAGGADTSVLYRKEEVDEAIANGHEIVCVEGEKDADRLWSIGIPATCNAHGASEPGRKPKWTVEHSKQLGGANIVVFGDHDAAGYEHQDVICKTSLGIAKRVRILKLFDHWADIPKGGDVSDWLDAGHTREELDTLIEQAGDYAPTGDTQQTPQGGCRPRGMEALKTMTFAPIKYVVPGIIVEGLTILAGKPKIGKSWMMYHAAIAVARGGFTLGDIHCQEGDVLYCALEDNERRLQSRATKLLGIVQDWPKRMQYFCLGEMPRLNDGGIDKLKAWIDSVPTPRLIVIDTFVAVRAPKKNNQPNFDADYESGKELQKLANESGIAIVIIHHLRKADADDPFDTVNATLGLTAVVDSVVILKREANAGFSLHGRGRDLPEIEKAMEFDTNACTWRVLGDAGVVRQSSQRTAILQTLETATEPMSPRDIAGDTGMKVPNVKFLLRKLLDDGLIEKMSHGKYRAKVSKMSAA
jgi:hypothetical protein